MLVDLVKEAWKGRKIYYLVLKLKSLSLLSLRGLRLHQQHPWISWVLETCFLVSGQQQQDTQRWLASLLLLRLQFQFTNQTGG